MKINFLLPDLSLTGGHRVNFELANRLSRDHDVVIYFPFIPIEYSNVNKSYSDDREWTNIRKCLGALRRSNVYSEGKWFNLYCRVERLFTFSPRFSRYVNSQIREADVVISHGWRTNSTMEILDEDKGRKVYFAQHYDIWKLWSDEEVWDSVEEEDISPLDFVDMELEGELLKHRKEVNDYLDKFDTIITSSFEAEVMEKLGVEPLGKVSLGIDFDTFRPEEVASSNSIHILALYRDSKHKGDKQALESFQKLYSEHPNVRFEMFGREPPENLPNFIEFHRSPDERDLRTIYSKADILVYPSWVEGWGMPPMEAMACKTALVSTDVGAVDDYTPEEGVEFVPVGDSGAIVEKVNRILEDRKKLERMKERNYAYIQDYTWERTVNQFEDLISG